jgi:hypothetical protein
MAMNWCAGCGRLFHTERFPAASCSPECQQLADRSREQPKPVRRQTISVAEGWQSVAYFDEQASHFRKSP